MKNARKARFEPPAFRAAGGSARMIENMAELFVLTSREVVDILLPTDVAPCGMPRWLYLEVELDLLRFVSQREKRVAIDVGYSELGRPFFYFPKHLTDQWLDAGGREWLLAEAEVIKGNGVIVPFPGGRDA